MLCTASRIPHELSKARVASERGRGSMHVKAGEAARGLGLTAHACCWHSLLPHQRLQVRSLGHRHEDSSAWARLAFKSLRLPRQHRGASCRWGSSPLPHDADGIVLDLRLRMAVQTRTRGQVHMGLDGAGNTAALSFTKRRRRLELGPRCPHLNRFQARAAFSLGTCDLVWDAKF